MLWIILSLTTALCVASQDAWVKKHFAHLSSYEMAVIPMAFSFPLFAGTLLFVQVPHLDRIFWICMLVSLPLNAVCFTLYMRAIQISPLSLTLPYLAFTPVFAIIPGYMFLGEWPNLWGGAGILLTVLGSFVLNLNPKEANAGLRSAHLTREQGSLLMLIVAFLFGFAVVIGKVGIVHSSVMFFTMLFFAALNLSMVLILGSVGKVTLKSFSEKPVKGMTAGILLFLHALFHGWAVSLTKVVYMISVKRLSILIGVLFGGLFFKEENIPIRAAGTLLMLAGAVIIMIIGYR
jgi:drug/metabolite transporter (DMT)-like permease